MTEKLTILITDKKNIIVVILKFPSRKAVSFYLSVTGSLILQVGAHSFSSFSVFNMALHATRITNLNLPLRA